MLFQFDIFCTLFKNFEKQTIMFDSGLFCASCLALTVIRNVWHVVWKNKKPVRLA